VPVQPTVEGLSPEQQVLLAELLAGFGSSRIAQVVVRPFTPLRDDGPAPPGDYGDEVFVSAEPDDLRGRWEAELFGVAFARRSNEGGSRKLAWLALTDGGRRLPSLHPAAKPLAPDAIAGIKNEVASAPGDCRLAEFEVLRPDGHAVALAVDVDDPHRFLRFHGLGFLELVAPWRRRCDGFYGEIRDGAAEPALTVGSTRTGGFSSTRPDVACCAPDLARHRPTGSEWPPPCPIYG
jgi:hypothetical protein